MHRSNCPSLSFLNGVHETLMGPIAAHKPHPLFVGPGLEHKFLTPLATPLVITWCWVLKNIHNRARAMVKLGGAVAQTLYVLMSSILTLHAYRYGTHMLPTTTVVLAHDFPIQGCERTEWEKQKKCLRDISVLPTCGKSTATSKLCRAGWKPASNVTLQNVTQNARKHMKRKEVYKNC